MKRGFMFSMLGVLLSGLFILLFWLSNSPRLDSGMAAVNTRVTIMDSYLVTWDSFIEDATRSSTRLVLLALTTAVRDDTSAVTVTQMEQDIVSYLLDGTGSYGVLPDVPANLIEQQLDTFVALAAKQLNIITVYNLSRNITVTDVAPFQLQVNVTVNYTISDTLFARWNRSQRFTILLPLEGMPDPLFARYQNGSLDTAVWNRTLVRSPVPRDLLNISGVDAMLVNGTYVANRGFGPSYLERLAGILTAGAPSSRAGIETLVDPATVELSWLSLAEQNNASFTAHQIFDQDAFACGNESFGLIGLPAAFRLDIAHLARYNFNDTATWDATC